MMDTQECHRRRRRLLTAVLTAGALVGVATGFRWGAHGHVVAGRAAATALPEGMPRFFRDAGERLAWLNPEPDRWRGDEGGREMSEAFRYDHYIDFEVLPPGALDMPDRWAYLDTVMKAGIGHPREAGFLPFRILEMYQRVENGFRRWRAETNPEQRGWLEQRIIDDAGVLGHYVTDGANPHHTTVHHDRWAEGYPNPHGYTTERGFHSRFESRYVQTHIEIADLLPAVRTPRRLEDVRAGVLAYLHGTHGELERLYRLDAEQRFGEETTARTHHEFTVARLAAGANMLRDLWHTAWIASATPTRTR